MLWNEDSRRALLKFTGVSRQHAFFIPDGSALVRKGYVHDWVKVDLQKMKRFWAEYKMGLFSKS